VIGIVLVSVLPLAGTIAKHWFTSRRAAAQTDLGASER